MGNNNKSQNFPPAAGQKKIAKLHRKDWCAALSTRHCSNVIFRKTHQGISCQEPPPVFEISDFEISRFGPKLGPDFGLFRGEIGPRRDFFEVWDH